MWLCDKVYIGEERKLVASYLNFKFSLAADNEQLLRNRKFMQVAVAFENACNKCKQDDNGRLNVPFLSSEINQIDFICGSNSSGTYIRNEDIKTGKVNTQAIEDCDDSILYSIPMYMILKYISTEEYIKETIIENPRLGLNNHQYDLFLKSIRELQINNISLI